MNTDFGRSPDGSGSRPSGGAAKASPAKPSIPNAVKPDAELDLAALSALIAKATMGPWRIDRGGTNLHDTIWITAYEREGLRRAHNPICSVSTKQSHYKADEDHFGNSRGSGRSWETPVPKAEDDAKLIVAAVNALPELLRRLGYDGSETAWLIEWPADDYGPIRYWSAGRPRPVIDVNKATRFSRQEDAVAVMGAHAEKGAKAHEHMWVRPASAIEAFGRDGETRLDAQHESAVAKPDAPKVSHD